MSLSYWIIWDAVGTLKATNISAAHLAQICANSQPFYDTAALWPIAMQWVIKGFLCSFDRETLVRLQSENKMLCVQEETYRQKLVEMQAELEDTQRSNNALESQDRWGTRLSVCLSIGPFFWYFFWLRVGVISSYLLTHPLDLVLSWAVWAGAEGR